MEEALERVVSGVEPPMKGRKSRNVVSETLFVDLFGLRRAASPLALITLEPQQPRKSRAGSAGERSERTLEVHACEG
jgi:hypothetical protein